MNRQQKRKRVSIESPNEDNKRELRPRVAKQAKLEAAKPNKKPKLTKSTRKSVKSVKEVVEDSVPTQSESCSSNKLDELYKGLPFELYCVIAALETDKLDGLGSTPSTESGQFNANPNQIDQTILNPNKSSNKKRPIGQEQLNRTKKLLGDESLSKCEDDTTSQSSQLPEIEHPIECDESEKLGEPLNEPGQLIDPPIEGDEPVQFVESQIDQNQANQFINQFSSGDEISIEAEQFIRPATEPRQLVEIQIDQNQTNQSSQLSNSEPPNERDEPVQLVNPPSIPVQSVDLPTEPVQLVDFPIESKQLVEPQIDQNQVSQSSQLSNTQHQIESDEPRQLINTLIDKIQANQSSQLSNTDPLIQSDKPVQSVDLPAEPIQLVEPPIESKQLADPSSIPVQFVDPQIEPKQLFNSPIEPRQLAKPPIESKNSVNPQTESKQLVEAPIEHDEPRQLIDKIQANQSSQFPNTDPLIERDKPVQSVDLPTEPIQLVQPPIESKQLVDPPTEPIQLVEPPIHQIQANQSSQLPNIDPLIERDESRQLIDTLIDQIQANQSSQLFNTEPQIEQQQLSKQLVKLPTEPRQLVEPPNETKQLVESLIDQIQANESSQLSNKEPPIKRDAPVQFVDPQIEPIQLVEAPIESKQLVDPSIVPRQLIDTMIDQIEANQSSQLPNTDPPIERDEPRQLVKPPIESEQLIDSPIEPKQSSNPPTEPKQSVDPPTEPVQLVEPPIEATQSGSDPKVRQTTQVGPPKYHRYINTFSSCHTDSESTRDSNPSYGFSLIIQVPVSSLTTIHFPASVCSYLMDRYAKQLDHNQQFFDQFARKMKQKSNTNLDPTVLNLPIEQVDTYALIRYSVRMTIQFGATVSRILKLSLLTIPRCISDLFPVTECFDKDSLDTIISYEQVRKAAAERQPLYFPQPKELPEMGTPRKCVTKKIS